MDAQVASLTSNLFVKNCKAIFCNLSSFACEKQYLEKNSRVGPCNLPSGFLCLTFHEMAAFARTIRQGDSA
jgi:hypothetical protein